MDEQEQKGRNQSLPQSLHDRVRRSAEEFRRFLLFLSGGGFAVVFIALTIRTEPPLSLAQQIMGLMSIVSMAVAALSGVACCYGEYRLNDLWATALQLTDRNKRSALHKRRDQYAALAKISGLFLMMFFVWGILATLAYTALRVLDQ